MLKQSRLRIDGHQQPLSSVPQKWRSIHHRSSAVLVFNGLMLLSPTAPVAIAVSIPTTQDVNFLRTPLGPNEGYLNYSVSRADHERTGWTDQRVPSYYDGGAGQQITTKDTLIGFDRSDHWVAVRNITVTDFNGATPNPDHLRDYDYANQIYEQIGISVETIHNLSVQYNNPTNAVVYPVGNPNVSVIEIDNVRSVIANRDAPPTINNYYIRDFDPRITPMGVDVVYGLTRSPEDPGNPSIFVVDPTHGSRNDSFAHELGHFLLDQYRFAGPSVHAANNAELMAGGVSRNIPNLDTKNSSDLAHFNSAPSDPGLMVGNIGRVSHFNAQVGVPTGGAVNANMNQALGIYNAAADMIEYVQRRDNSPTYGDVADFDWVEDNRILENAGGLADDTRGAQLPMVWEISPAGHSPSAHLGHVAGDMHDHGAWGELTLPTYNQKSFRIIDVVSQISRYADMDVNPSGMGWSGRESALDYEVPKFSADGVNWVDGTLAQVFIPGWTNASGAEDYVARFISPIDARFVSIQSEPYAGHHDGNVQIDAIIAAGGPTPNGKSKTTASVTPGIGYLFSPGTGILSFANGILDSLSPFGLDTGIASQFASDPILGSTLSISEFNLLAPWDDGFLFGNGSLRITQGLDLLFSADIPFLLLDESMRGSFGINLIGDLTNMYVNPSFNSPFLTQFMLDALDPSVITTELYLTTDGDLASAVRMGQSASGSASRTSISHSTIPEPVTSTLQVIALATLAGVRRCRRS